MGGWSARKCLLVVEHVEIILAIELLAACQAIDLLRPLKSTEPLERVHKLVRTVVNKWDQDRFMQPDIQAAHYVIIFLFILFNILKLIKSGKIVEAVSSFLPND